MHPHTPSPADGAASGGPPAGSNGRQETRLVRTIAQIAAALGFVLARLLPTWSVVGLALAIELFLGYAIRDNLTLNIVQLVHPSEAISEWQMRR